jgi:hypothetical protein
MSSIAHSRTLHTHIPLIDVLVYGFIAASAVSYMYITYRADLLIHTSHSDFVTFLLTHLSLIVPEIVVWGIAAVGALKLKAYARSVGWGSDGTAFNYIADALLVLVVYSVAISLATDVKILFKNTSVLQAATVLTVHVPVMLALISSMFLFIGTYELSRLASEGLRRLSPRVVEFSLVAFVMMITVFTWYFYVEAPRRVDDEGMSRFSLPAGVLLVTYVLPHIIMWLLGLLACLHLAHYSRYVKGRIYKAFVRGLTIGVLTVYISTYIVQILYVTNISSRHFSPALFLVLLVLLLLMAGYLFIYRGASLLQRIEAK